MKSTAENPRTAGKNPKVTLGLASWIRDGRAFIKKRGTVRDADESANSRLGSNRPSTGRGSGSDPEPPCAFETSMIKVSCNSH